MAAKKKQAASSAPGVKGLPGSAFAGPNRSYPVNTPGRAVAAKGRATDAVKAGRLTSAQAAAIKAKANAALGKKAGKSKGRGK